MTKTAKVWVSTSHTSVYFFFLLLCGLSLGERECTGSTGVVGALSCLDSGGGFGGYMVISFISIVTFISVVNNVG